MDEYFQYKCTSCQKDDWRKDFLDIPCRACGKEVSKTPDAAKLFPRFSDRSPLDVVIHATGDTDRLHSQRTADDEYLNDIPGDESA